MSSTAGFLDRYLDGDSFLHRADARVKLVVTLGFIFATTAIPVGVWPAFGAMLFLVWGAALASRLGLGRVFRRSLIALPFVLVVVPTIFTKPGPALFVLDLGVGHLTATTDGAIFCASVMLKSWTSVTAAALLTSTTPPLQLIEGLKSLRVPTILVAIVSLMYRYLFILVEEVQRLLRARKARSASNGDYRSGGTVGWRAKTTGGMAGSLFIRTLDRSERIYMAMLARGYDGRTRRLSGEPVGRASMSAAGAALAVFAAIATLSHFVG